MTDNKLTDRERIFGPSSDQFFWCLHCERAYPKALVRIDRRGLEMCHYKDCDGDAVIDAWEWSVYRDGRESRPHEPEIGVTYPLYD